VHAYRPRVDLLLRDTAVFLQARQNVGEIVPVPEAVIQSTEQGERVAVVPRVLVDAPQGCEGLLILSAVQL
jgi:hypothetical protein